MEYKLVINGTLPNLNDYISKLNVNKFRGNELKRKAEAYIKPFIKSQLRDVKISRPVILKYIWIEPDRKRDLDNICSFGMKVIQDALVRNGVLLNDGWNCVKGFMHDFDVDKSNPRVEIIIEECIT